MAIDPSRFYLHNIIDTCGVWNVLSSLTLYRQARIGGVNFICTGFVIYECLFKPRKSIHPCDLELCSRLHAAQQAADFKTYPLDIADLQTIEILENRKRLGKGELSSLAFALKTGQAFLTDDQKARKLAREVMRTSVTQTTPHLVGWLFFTRQLVDGEKDIIIREHEEMNRQLSNYFEEMYLEACRCRSMLSLGGVSDE
jgi:predicted nucleic acid-binding protein